MERVEVRGELGYLAYAIGVHGACALCGLGWEHLGECQVSLALVSCMSRTSARMVWKRGEAQW